MIKVKCISKNNIVSSGNTKSLTVGKYYYIYEKDEWRLHNPNSPGIIEIKNDLGLERYYSSGFFKTDSKIREEKINEVLDGLDRY